MVHIKRLFWTALVFVGIVYGGRYLLGVYQQYQRLSMIDDYLLILTQNPSDTGAMINLCSSYSEVGELDKGLDYCNQALTIEPDLADALQNRAAIYYQQGELEKALIDYQAQLQLAEKYSWHTIRTFRYDLIKQAITRIEGELAAKHNES